MQEKYQCEHCEELSKTAERESECLQENEKCVGVVSFVNAKDKFHISHLYDEGLEVVNRWPSIYLEPNSIVKKMACSNSSKNKELCNLKYGFELPYEWLILSDKFGQFATSLVEELRESKIQEDAFIKTVSVGKKMGLFQCDIETNIEAPFLNIIYRYLDFLAEESMYIIIDNKYDSQSIPVL